MSAVLIRDDDSDAFAELGEVLRAHGIGCRVSRVGEDLREILVRDAPEIMVADSRALDDSEVALLKDGTSVPFILMADHPTTEEVVRGMRAGALDFFEKSAPADIRIGVIKRHLPRHDVNLHVAVSRRSVELFDLARKVAKTNVSVMVSGESGTGKEVLARFIHESSSRDDGPFVAINCAAIPEHMLEAMLFGYEKGAYTGAIKSSPGKFEAANGGTLLLDEISEMDLGLQAKLLRVLQEREVERLGGHTRIKLNLRVIATTNRKLLDMVGGGEFREDLYYRLNVFPLHVLPLRDRVDDIVPLAQLFIRKYAGNRSWTLSTGSIDALCSHDWPGNVRELENVLQRALVLAEGSTIEPDHLTLESSNSRPEGNSLNSDVKRAEYERIYSELQRHGASRAVTARALGIGERTLRNKLQQMREIGYSV